MEQGADPKLYGFVICPQQRTMAEWFRGGQPKVYILVSYEPHKTNSVADKRAIPQGVEPWSHADDGTKGMHQQSGSDNIPRMSASYVVVWCHMIRILETRGLMAPLTVLKIHSSSGNCARFSASVSCLRCSSQAEAELQDGQLQNLGKGRNKHNFLSFWPNEVQKEPKQGFLIVLDPLDTSIFLFEPIDTCKHKFENFNERGLASEAGPRDISQEKGELLYHAFVSDMLRLSLFCYKIWFKFTCLCVQ